MKNLQKNIQELNIIMEKHNKETKNKLQKLIEKLEKW